MPGSCRPGNGKKVGEETDRAAPRASMRGNASLERGCYCPHVSLLKQKGNYIARVKPKKVKSGGSKGKNLAHLRSWFTFRARRAGLGGCWTCAKRKHDRVLRRSP